MGGFKVFIITEGSSEIGFGHITRMLSIYQAFEEKGIKPMFIINGDDSIEDLIKDTDYIIYDWIDAKEKLFNQIKNADIAIIDSYLAGFEVYEKISKVVRLPVYYDDNKRLDYPCGVVINGNIHAFDLDYPKKDCIDYLLGLKYLPLRKEFWEVPEKRVKEKVDTIMITFGGEDTKNMTTKILRILRENYPSFKKKVVIGKGFKNLNEIKQECDKNTELIYYPEAKDMLNTMLESDITISAAGQTLYELSRIGVPTVAILVADNQRGNLKGFVEKGFIDNFISWDEENLEENLIKSVNDLLDKNKRESKNQIGKSLVDGRGSINIVSELWKKLILKNSIFREASKTDIWDIYEISNDKEVREVSINSSSISEAEHKVWFLRNYSRNFYVLEFKNKVIGQVRFKEENGSYIVSISLHRDFRNLGLGKYLLQQGIEKFFIENKEANTITAYIKEKNLKSKHIFQKIGFKYCCKENDLEKYILEREYYENRKDIKL